MIHITKEYYSRTHEGLGVHNLISIRIHLVHLKRWVAAYTTKNRISLDPTLKENAEFVYGYALRGTTEGPIHIVFTAFSAVRFL